MSRGGCNLIWARMRPARLVLGLSGARPCRLRRGGSVGDIVAAAGWRGAAPALEEWWGGLAAPGRPGCVPEICAGRWEAAPMVPDGASVHFGCASARAQAPGEACGRESIGGCEGARGREANHACGEVGLMSCGAVARAARSVRAERSADIDFT